MGSRRKAIYRRWSLAAYSLPACAAALLLTAGLALAQDNTERQAHAAADEPGLFESIAQWFDRQAAKIGSGFKDAGSQVENFGREAGIAAKTDAIPAGVRRRRA